jgi:hypothetical protein
MKHPNLAKHLFISSVTVIVVLVLFRVAALIWR